MGEASDVIEDLRPVVFRYREDVVGKSEAAVLRYGLIAEEVAKVAPRTWSPTTTWAKPTRSSTAC